MTIETYLSTLRDRPHVTYLWFEYWIDASRKGRTAAVRQMHDQVTRLLAERLHAAGNPQPHETAKALFVYLLGAIVEQSVAPPTPGFGLRPADEVDSPTGFAAWVARLADESDPAKAVEAGRVRCTRPAGPRRDRRHPAGGVRPRVYRE